MAFSLVQNGRKFIIDWTLREDQWSVRAKQDFTIGDSCFLLEYYYTGSTNFSLKLLKRQPQPKAEKKGESLTQPKGYSIKLQPRRVIVSIDDGKSKVMTKTSTDQWEYAGYQLTQAREKKSTWNHRQNDHSSRVHFRIKVDCESLKKRGEFNLLNNLRQRLYSGTDADIEFIVKGEKIFGHKFMMLLGESPVLAAMFQHDMTEKASGTIEIKDIEPIVFRQLLHFLYTGDAPDIEGDDMTEPLFVTADKYGVESLKDWCGSILSERLQVENTMPLLKLAEKHSADELKEVCIDFIVNNKAKFWEMDESTGVFEKLSASDCKEDRQLFYQINKRMNKRDELATNGLKQKAQDVDEDEQHSNYE
jgi:speckle-type POZ protein